MKKKYKAVLSVIPIILLIIALIKYYDYYKKNQLACQNYSTKLQSLNKLIISENKLNVDFIKSSTSLLESYNRDLIVCNRNNLNSNLNELYETVYNKIGLLLKKDTTDIRINNSLEICALCDLLITVCRANKSIGYIEKCGDNHENIIYNIKTLKCNN